VGVGDERRASCRPNAGGTARHPPALPLLAEGTRFAVRRRRHGVKGRCLPGDEL